MKYEIKDTLTDDIYTNLNINEVSKMLNTKCHTVYRAIVNERKIEGRYIVTSYNDNVEGRYKFPNQLLNEWDSVCSRFRIYYSKNVEVNE